MPINGINGVVLTGKPGNFFFPWKKSHGNLRLSGQMSLKGVNGPEKSSTTRMLGLKSCDFYLWFLPVDGIMNIIGIYGPKMGFFLRTCGEFSNCFFSSPDFKNTRQKLYSCICCSIFQFFMGRSRSAMARASCDVNSQQRGRPQDMAYGKMGGKGGLL